jgi:hypothetical protein
MKFMSFDHVQIKPLRLWSKKVHEVIKEVPALFLWWNLFCSILAILGS